MNLNRFQYYYLIGSETMYNLYLNPNGIKMVRKYLNGTLLALDLSSRA
jgi:hypothetical protein